MALGRISGPLLRDNLYRDGVDIAFETDLLYIDVQSGRIGIKASRPAGNLTHELTVVGTTRTTNLIVDTQADIASFTVTGNIIASSNGTISLEPSGSNPVVYQAKLVLDDLQISTNTIAVIAADQNLVFETLGTGEVNINSSVTVNGDLHATGVITADGDIQIGSTDQSGANEDTVTFNAEVASDIIPDADDTYNLGSDPTVVGGKAWATTYVKDIFTSSITADTLVVNGIDLILPQGNIIYVAENGSDTNAGLHEHNPVLTVKHALDLATNGDTVYVYPGTYTEIFPLTIPVGVTLKGAGLRSVTIQPTAGTVTNDAILLNGETTVEDLTITGFRFDSGANTGYGLRFANDFTVTTRSPYIRNITVVTRGSVVSTGDPYGFDQNDAGKGVLADGSVANASSKEAAMLFHSVTFFTPNQETVTVTNGVRIEWLNSFSYFADKGMYAYSSSAGFAGAGKTRLRIDNRTGTWALGNVVTYYDTDGTTVLASGTIENIDGNYIDLTGRALGFETITDRVTKTVYAQGNAKLSSLQQQFGATSLALDGTGDYINLASTPDFGYETGAFTIEMWIYRTVSGATQILYDQRTAASTTYAPLIFISASNVLTYGEGTTTAILGTTTIPLNAWSHIAVSRSGTSTKLFLNGTQEGPTYTDTRNYIATPVTIGMRFDGSTLPFTGYIDDVRVSKGIARYTTTFLVPTSAFVGDLNTVLLLHFNGVNNSTTILDDGITLQDLRTDALGTASIINFADYSDFGAEIRSIGSANVYGTYGTYGDGAGVIVYLISQNYAYVGAGKLSTNDPNDRIAANEVVEINSAKIYYTSVDNEGNFKVGDKFYINQKTGDVLFNNQSLTITAAEGVTFTDGINTTTITPVNIDTGNIRISGNTVESLTGDVNVTAASGSINLQNTTYITGDLDVTGDVNIGGNIQIGDNSSDTVSFVAGITSDLIPATTASYDLGTDLLRWNNAYLSRVEIDKLVIDSNRISTTFSNDDLQLTANGTGRIYIPSNNVQIDQNLTVTQDLTVTTGTTFLKNTTVVGDIDQTGDINQTGNFTTSGNTEVTGNITGTGYLRLPQIEISSNIISTRVSGTDLELQANGTGNVVFEGLKVTDNNIQSTVTNSNVILSPQGTGSVVINSNQSLIIPVGTSSDRPTGANGMIRYNTDLSRYEGWNGTYWLALSGVQDADGNTKIIAESAPGANENILYFYADGNLTATIDSTKLYTTKFQTNNIDITDNTISAIAADTDINITTAGIGAVKVGNLKIRNNSITNVVSNAITEFVETGTGYVRIAGTNGVVIPSGDNSQLPTVPEIGMIRFNTFYSIVEVFDGVSWVNVAGTNSGISAAQATDIGVQTVLMLG